MPVLSNLLGRRVRTTGDNPARSLSAWTWPWTATHYAGSTVSDETALSLTAFYRGISLIAGTIAGLPLHVHRELTDGTSERDRSPDTAYLHRRPNIEMTRQSFWERILADEVRGNAFIFVDKNGFSRPAEIWWVERTRVRTGRTSDKRKVYEIDNYLPMMDYKEGGEIVHIPNWGDSLLGYDPTKIAAQAIALGLSAEEYAARTFGSGQVPPGILSTEQELTEEQADAIAGRWEQLHGGGLATRFKIAVLGGGAKFQQTSVNPIDQQLEAIRSFQVIEIARLLGIPPHLLGAVDRSTSWGTGIEEQNRAFVTFTLGPHIKRIEQAIDDALLTRELTNLYCKFDLGGLLRGNTLQRYQAYRLANFMTLNEKRALEDLPPVEGGDELLAAVTDIPLERLLEEPEPAQLPAGRE